MSLVTQFLSPRDILARDTFYEQILEWRAMLCKKVTIKNSLNRQIGLQDNLKWTLYRKTFFWICHESILDIIPISTRYSYTLKLV